MAGFSLPFSGGEFFFAGKRDRFFSLLSRTFAPLALSSYFFFFLLLVGVCVPLLKHRTRSRRGRKRAFLPFARVIRIFPARSPGVLTWDDLLPFLVADSGTSLSRDFHFLSPFFSAILPPRFPVRSGNLFCGGESRLLFFPTMSLSRFPPLLAACTSLT